MSATEGLPKHRGSHPRYTEYVKAEMDKILDEFQEDLLSPNLTEATKAKIRDRIESLQDQLEDKMRNGEIGVANKTWDED